ncbi:MAG: polysaccharide lyase family 7 protein [Acidobacteriaceae bacterium]|nr:polysaccharide lyase family 7 protein [Acidobacteriaceae bacterium]
MHPLRYRANARLTRLLACAVTGASVLLFGGCATASAAASPASPAAPTTTTTTAGALGFDATTQVVAQSGGTAYFLVYRTGGSTGAVTVNWATGGGTATAGTDYTSASGVISWADGDSAAKTISVPILDKTPSSDKETFHIDLTSPTGDATLGTYPEAVVSIKNSFTAPSTITSFNFTPWKLTLPINEYRTADATYTAWSISPSVINNKFADAYFYASGSTVVFYSPANGATTTPGSGSDHTRSELRELYTGSGADSNSDWSSSIGGTLTGSCTINSVAPNTDEATFAQIHGQTYVFVLLDWRVSTGNVELAVYSSNASGATKTNYVVKSGVTLGTALTYSLAYSGSTVTAVVNGSTKSVTVDSSWTGTPVYFKAGAYHSAPNTGNGATDATQVTYTALGISH